MPQASLSSPPFVTSPEPSNLHCFRVKALTSSRIDASMVINFDETVADGGSLHLQDFVIFNFSVPVFFYGCSTQPSSAEQPAALWSHPLSRTSRATFDLRERLYCTVQRTVLLQYDDVRHIEYVGCMDRRHARTRTCDVRIAMTKPVP